MTQTEVHILHLGDSQHNQRQQFNWLVSEPSFSRSTATQSRIHSLSDFVLGVSSCAIELPDGFACLEEVLLDKRGDLYLQRKC